MLQKMSNLYPRKLGIIKPNGNSTKIELKYPNFLYYKSVTGGQIHASAVQRDAVPAQHKIHLPRQQPTHRTRRNQHHTWTQQESTRPRSSQQLVGQGRVLGHSEFYTS